jgi:hypothetical protein
MWDILTDYLKQFRDYQSGTELVLEGLESDEELFADLAYSGLTFELHDMSWQCRLAAQELAAGSSVGRAIVRTLLERLSKTEGDTKLNAAWIAWECRNCPPLRAWLIVLTEQMMLEDHLALVMLGGRLPSYYSLSLPPDPEADQFEKPSGYSQYSAGLWTEDTKSWTWPLGTALRLLTRASSFDISTLRRRVGAIMRWNGGRGSFGPEVSELRMRTLRRLDLEITYRRVAVLAAFRAFRQLCFELLAACECDPAAIPLLLSERGGPSHANIRGRATSRCHSETANHKLVFKGRAC